MNTPKTWLALAVLVAGFVATAAINWPGHLSYDSILQLQQGRTGLYNTWHPPVMAWLMGLGDAVLPGSGLFVLFQTAMAFGGLAALLLLPDQKAGWRSAVTAALLILLPQMLLYQGLVWKDVLFADAAVAGFAALAWSGRYRVGAVAVSFVLLILAALTRQNGLVLLPFAAGAWGWMLVREGVPARRAAAAGLAALVLLGAAHQAASALLKLRSDGNPGPEEQVRLLQAYDLSGALAREPGLALPTLNDDDPVLERVLREKGAKLYTPVRNDPLAADPEVSNALGNSDPVAIGAAWREAFLAHPWLYVRVRAAAFAWVFATPDQAACRPVFVGVEGPADAMAALKLPARRDGRDRMLDRYGKAFFGTPVWSHIAYALLAAGCLVVLLRRRQEADVAVAAMLLSAFAFVVSFFFISIACDYRYLYFLDLSALAAVLYLSADGRRWWSWRQSSLG
jgi:hypothetical protein